MKLCALMRSGFHRLSETPSGRPLPFADRMPACIRRDMVRTRKYRNDRSELAEEGKRLLRSSEQYRLTARVTVVTMVMENPGKESVISELSGIPLRTLRRWVTIADLAGFHALQDRFSPGRPASLSEEQKMVLRGAVNDAPSRYGYDSWTGASVRDFFRRTFQCSLGERQCQRLLRSMRQKS